MHRWHESGCRRPDVSAATGLPTCSYCFAIPLEEPPAKTLGIPQLHDRRRINLSWPPAVTYSNRDSEEQIQDDHDMPDIEPDSLPPRLPSDDSIRLLRLMPGTDDEPLHADYEVVSINQIPLPMYEAISYTSVPNNADSECPVYIGCYWDVAYVSSNCEKALRRLRRRKSERLIWADALCINQTSPGEKSAQVHVLREIYTRATKVLAFIGDQHSDYEPALGYLREITTVQPSETLVPDKETQKSLSKLLEQPYFSRLWVVQETLIARELEIVCGRLSARWLRRPFDGNWDVNVPTWLFRDPKWHPFSGKDLLNVLVEASQYQCSDPRDKVFAVLGLMGEKFIAPDYQLPIESIFIGIAAYLLKECQAMDLLGLAGQGNRAFDIPSWVPDWSRRLSSPSMNSLVLSRGKDLSDRRWIGALRVNFDTFGTHHIEVSSSTGTLRVHGFKLADLAGERHIVHEHIRIEMHCNSKGHFVIMIPNTHYEVHESDVLFLLNGYNNPVILRKVDNDTYTLVSPCLLSIGRPWRKVLVPWYRRPMQPLSGLGLAVAALTGEDSQSVEQVYSRLAPTIEADNSTQRNRVMSFLMLPLAAIQNAEYGLRAEWTEYNQQLGWMFRDQSAVWQFMKEVYQFSLDQRTGEDTLVTKGADYLNDIEPSGDISRPYTWDLSQFCWSFLQPTDDTYYAQEATDLQWSPMVDHLRSHLEDIRNWAQTTEKLLTLFEYTKTSLSESWDNTFPGSLLPQKWTDNYTEFQAGAGLVLFLQVQAQQEHDQGTGIGGGPGPQQRPFLIPEGLWSMNEFEASLRVREEIWERTADERMVSGNVRAHALLRYLGLELYDGRVVDIV